MAMMYALSELVVTPSASAIHEREAPFYRSAVKYFKEIGRMIELGW